MTPISGVITLLTTSRRPLCIIGKRRELINHTALSNIEERRTSPKIPAQTSGVCGTIRADTICGESKGFKENNENVPLGETNTSTIHHEFSRLSIVSCRGCTCLQDYQEDKNTLGIYSIHIFQHFCTSLQIVGSEKMEDKFKFTSHLFELLTCPEKKLLTIIWGTFPSPYLWCLGKCDFPVTMNSPLRWVHASPTK